MDASGTIVILDGQVRVQVKCQGSSLPMQSGVEDQGMEDASERLIESRMVGHGDLMIRLGSDGLTVNTEGERFELKPRQQAAGPAVKAIENRF